MKHAHARRTPRESAASAKLEAVIQLASTGALDQARQVLAPLIQTNPVRDDLLHLRGLLSAGLQDAEGAIVSIRAAIALNATLPRYHFDLGMALFSARQWQAATAAFAQARKLDPVEFNTASEMAQCQFELHCEEGLRQRQQWQLNQALMHARTAAALRPEEPRGHTLCGIIEYELGEYGSSLNSHDTASRLAHPAEEEMAGLAAQARERIWSTEPPATRYAPRIIGLSQRGFEELYLSFIASGELPAAAQSYRHALADDVFPEQPNSELLLPEAIKAAKLGELDATQDLLSRWLTSDSDGCWLLLHDSDGHLRFAQDNTTPNKNTAKAGLLLELTLKCSHPTLRHAAGFTLIEQLRAAGDMRQANSLVDFLDDEMYYKYQRRNLSSLSARGRLRCVVFGTCITRGLVYLLNLSEEFRRRVAIDAYVTNSANPIMSDFNVTQESVSSCGLLLHVPPQWADWGNGNFYPDLLARFDKAIPRISFPYPVFHPLWPYHCNDKRNKDPSLRNAQGQQAVYPYGDSYVLGLMRTHPTASAEQIARLYTETDIPETIDLQGLMRHCFKHQRLKEQRTDVKIMDFIEENFASKRLFLAVNHVSNVSLIHMANQVLRMMDMPTLPEATADRLRDLIDPQIPIHPSILRYFNVSYLNPESRYNVDDQRSLNFREYIEQYVLFG